MKKYLTIENLLLILASIAVGIGIQKKYPISTENTHITDKQGNWILAIGLVLMIAYIFYPKKHTS